MTLTEQIKIYVPSTTAVYRSNKKAQDKWTDKVLRQFAVWFGGATVMPATGAYVTTEGKLVKESVQIVYSFATPDTFMARHNDVLALAAQMGQDMQQECVSVEFSGRMELVEITPVMGIAEAA